MGVKGLLPSLRSITRQIDLDKYRGLTVAVDAMCWLHKGIFTANVGALAKYQFNEEQMQQRQQGIAKESLETKKEREQTTNTILASTIKRLDFDKFTSQRDQRKQHEANSNVDAIEAMSKCIDYVTRHSIELQKKYDLELILVIDGDALPSKHNVNEKRRIDRADSFQKGLNAEKRGDGRQARKLFSRACSITYEMRHELIIQCKRFRIPFIVAPYEADAQMAKLAHSGEVDLVITEDSDMLVYGCPRVLFKIDFKTGKGDEIQLMQNLATNEPLSFRHWNHDMFVYMCVLAGCDYCEGIAGVGIQTAHKLVRIHRKPKKIFHALRTTGKLPEGFEESFLNAYRTFRHQRVFCSQKRAVENLFKIKEGGIHTDHVWDFLGPYIEPSIGIGIAEGKLHPREKIPWDEVKENKAKPKVMSRISTMMPVNCHQRKRLPMERSPIAKEKMTNPKNLFTFFRPKKRNNHDNKTKEMKSPPLKEVQIDQSRDSMNLPLHEDREFGKFHNQSIPSNYHDYSSHLVSGTFQPISRKNQKQSRHRRRGASKALRDLKLKLSLKNSRKKIKHDEKQVTEFKILKDNTINTMNQKSSSRHLDSVSDNIISYENSEPFVHTKRFDDFFTNFNYLEQIESENDKIMLCDNINVSEAWKGEANFISPTDISSFQKAAEYAQSEPICDKDTREWTFTEYTDSLSIVEEPIFHNRDQTELSFGEFDNDESQHQLSSTTLLPLSQNKSLALSELSTLENPREKVEDNRYMERFESFFRDTDCCNEFNKCGTMSNTCYGQYDHVVPRVPGYDHAPTGESNLLDSLHHFQCLYE